MKVKNFNFKGIITDPRRRTIAVTVVVSVLLLGGIIGAILNAVNRPAPSTSSPVDDIAIAVDSKLDPVDNSETGTTVVTTPEVPVTGETENLPKTGPEDVLPLILITIAATAYFATKKQKMVAPVGIEPTL